MTSRQPFGLGTFSLGGETFPGLVVADTVADLRQALGRDTTTGSLLQDWDDSLRKLRELSLSLPGDRIALADVKPMSPVQPPGQILCAGANYTRHVQQIVASFLRSDGDTRPDDELAAHAEAIVRQRRDEGVPFLFAGLSSALSGSCDDIVLWGPGREHDWELELAVVIGRNARCVPKDRAIEYIAGYTISNDISTRDVMNRPGLPMTDFISSKIRPGFLPTGPYIVPREFVPDPRKLRIRLRVNDKLMQDELVDDIIYGIEDLVSYASELVELHPGDMLLTGSPAGNAGHHGNRWLRPGDIVDGEITGLGKQLNRCVAPPS